MLKIAFFVFNAFTHDSRVLKEAVSLQCAGYEITIIAHGYRELKKDDLINNIKVKRLGYFDRTVTKYKLSKLIAYLNYALRSIVHAKTFNVMHCHDLNTLPIGIIVKLFFNRNAKIVYDAHESETEINGLSGIQKKIIKKLEKFLIKYVDNTITVSDSIADEYVRLYSIKKSALVLNTPAYQEIEKKDIFRDTFNIPKEKTIYLYQGGLSRGRGIETLLDTFAQVDEQNVIVFMGYGPLASRVQEYALKYVNIFYHEAVSPDVLLEYTSSADFGISSIEDSCLSYRYCLPNKMFEYLMADVPVIVSDLYEMRRVVEKNEVGLVLKKNTPDEIRNILAKAKALDVQVLKENIHMFKKEYNWQTQEKILVKIYNEL